MPLTKPASPVWNASGAGASGCKGYYLLHEGSGTTVNDISPAGNHGSMTAYRAIFWQTGEFGPEVGFSTNAQNNCLYLPNLSITQPFSVALMANLREGPYDYEAVCGKTNGVDWTLGFGVFAESGYLKFFVGVWNQESIGTPWPSGLHVVEVRFNPSTNLMQLYLDGTLAASGTKVSPYYDFSDNVGFDELGGGFNGALDRLVVIHLGDGSHDPAALAADWLNGDFSAARASSPPSSRSAVGGLYRPGGFRSSYCF